MAMIRPLWLPQRRITAECPFPERPHGAEALAEPGNLGIHVGILALRQDRLIRQQRFPLEMPSKAGPTTGGILYVDGR